MPYQSRTATQKPTLVYAINASGHISHEISRRMQDNYISTGIYRCTTLDFDMKFCENFCSSRISADKRFLMYVYKPASLPQTGASAGRSASANLSYYFESHKKRFSAAGAVKNTRGQMVEILYRFPRPAMRIKRGSLNAC